MISLFILVGVCFTADAKPYPAVASYAVDGIHGLLYEVPEYEEPDLALLQLAAMGIMPVLTALQGAFSPEEEDTTCLEEFSDVKKSLEGVIVGLEAAKRKIEEGSTDIENDIERSITTLTKLKHHIQVHMNSASSVSHESSASNSGALFQIPGAGKHFMQELTTTLRPDDKSRSKDVSKTKPMGDAIKKSMKIVVNVKQNLQTLNVPLALKDQEPYESSEDDHDSILDFKKMSTQSTTSSENSDPEINHDILEIRTLGDGVIVSEMNKYEDLGKTAFRKKSNWKPSKDE